MVFLYYNKLVKQMKAEVYAKTIINVIYYITAL